jgi:hypothetical protein
MKLRKEQLLKILFIDSLFSKLATERRGWVVNTSVSYLGGLGFKS